MPALDTEYRVEQAAGCQIIRRAVPMNAVDDALRHIHRDVATRGLPQEWLSQWLWNSHWFPHLRWDQQILQLLDQLPPLQADHRRGADSQRPGERRPDHLAAGRNGASGSSARAQRRRRDGPAHAARQRCEPYRFDPLLRVLPLSGRAGCLAGKWGPPAAAAPTNFLVG